MATPVIEEKIEHARHDLDGKLAEIERRIHAVRHALSFERLLSSPWARLGASVAAGFAVGVVGGHAVRSGVNLALGIGARRILRVAFEAAFEKGLAHASSASSPYPVR